MKKSKGMTDEQLAATWADYITTKDANLQNKLAEYYFPFVQKIAVKSAEKMNWVVQPDELASLGVDGLYNAIAAYDPSRGVRFESFASSRIKYSMIDGLRREDAVPRSVRIASDQFQKHKQRMQNHKGHRISDVEFVAMIGMDEHEFHKNHRKYSAMGNGSFDQHTDEDASEEIKPDSNENLIDSTVSSPDAKLRRKEFFSKLMSGNFSATERKIVYLYYYEKMTMDRVAQRIGLSESRVSQIHKKLMKRLEDKIRRNPTYFGADVAEYIAGCNHKQPLY